MYKGLIPYESGYCQLFEPRIWNDGLLAWWPDNNEYIEVFVF